MSYFQWCKRYPCFISNTKIPTIAALLVWGDTRLKSRDRTSHLAFYHLCISSGDHPQPAIPCFIFCINTKVIIFGSKQVHAEAQRNKPDLSRTISVSAVISPRTGQWGYTCLDDCREEQKAQLCLTQHLSCAPSCKQVPGLLPSLPSPPSPQSIAWRCWKPRGGNCTEDSNKPALKTGNEEASLCLKFSISVIYPEEIFFSFCWVLKRLA